jgi:protein phosphatase
MITAKYITNQGKRVNNEDALLVYDEIIVDNQSGVKKIEDNRGVFIVADGMGGYSRGEFASKLVLEAFEGSFDITKNIAIAKEILDKEVEKDKTLLGFGAVIAGVSIESNQATIFNCGDSRVYVYRKGFLEQLSYDHSVVQRLIDSGEIEPEESRIHPQKNIVTSAICGDLNSELPIFYSTKTVLKNDMIFFICSDGVWESGAISKLEVCFSDLDRVIACLEKIVIESEIEDNFSAIIVKIEEDRVL